MTKQAFNDALAAGLAGALPDSDVQQIIRFYAESIEDRMEDGMTEADAVEAVGPADVRVKEILAALEEIAAAPATTARAAEGEASTAACTLSEVAAETAGSTANDVMTEAVGCTATVVTNDVADTPASETIAAVCTLSEATGEVVAETPGRTTTDYAAADSTSGEAVDRVAGVVTGDEAGAAAGTSSEAAAHSADGAAAPGVTFLTMSPAGIRQIRVSTKNGDITVLPSGHTHIHVTYTDTDASHYVIQQQPDGILSIRQERRQDGDPAGAGASAGSLAGFLSRILHTTGNEPAAPVILRLPAAWCGALQIHTGNGDVSVENLAFDALSAHTGNGDVRASHLRVSGDVQISTASGDVQATALSAQRAALQAASGDMILQDLQTDRLEIKTASGDVTMDGCRTDTLSAATANGDMECRLDTPPKTAALKTANGDMTLALPQPLSQYTIQAKTVSGGVDIPACPMTGPCHIRLESASGDIRVTARSF